MNEVKEKAFRSFIADMILKISTKYGTNFNDTARLIGISEEKVLSLLKEEIAIDSIIMFKIFELLEMELIIESHEQNKVHCLNIFQKIITWIKRITK